MPSPPAPKPPPLVTEPPQHPPTPPPRLRRPPPPALPSPQNADTIPGPWCVAPPGAQPADAPPSGRRPPQRSLHQPTPPRPADRPAQTLATRRELPRTPHTAPEGRRSAHRLRRDGRGVDTPTTYSSAPSTKGSQAEGPPPPGPLRHRHLRSTST